MKFFLDGSKWFTISRIAGLLSGTMAVFVLVGWALNVPWIRSVLPGAVEMKVNTAIGLLLAGIALCLLDKHSSNPQTRLGQTLAFILLVLGLATLGEYVFGWQLGIDELIFHDTTSAYNPIRGRMSPSSAVTFAALGVALAALPKPRLRWLVWIMATLTLLIGGASLVGYFWNASELVTDRFLPPVAINTATAFVLLGIGIFMTCFDSGIRSIRQSIPFSPIERKAFIGFMGTLVLLLLAGGQTYRATVKAAVSARWVTHTQEVRARLGALYAAVASAKAEQRDYILSHKVLHREAYKQAALEAQHQIGLLARLIADNPNQIQHLNKLKALVEEFLNTLERSANIFEQAGLATTQELIAKNDESQSTETMLSLVKQMDFSEGELLNAREMNSSRDKLKTLLSLLSTLAVAIAGFLTLFVGIRREMTVRAITEESLRRSEEDLAVTIHSIGDAVLATDAQRHITRLNPAAERLTGWSQEDALGRSVEEVFQIINEETRLPALIPVDAVLETGKIQGLANHTVLITRDGSERPIADSAAPIRDRNGIIVGVVLVFRDVTEERRVQQEILHLNESLEQRVCMRTAELKQTSLALRESEERFRLMIEGVQDYSILILNTKGYVVNWNVGAQRLKGYLAKEIIGHHFSCFYPEEAVRTGLPEEILAVARREGRYEDEGWRVRKDGSRFWASGVITALCDESGSLRGFSNITRDITERKRAEDEIRELNANLEGRIRTRTQQLEEANKELESFSYSVSHDLRAPLRHVQGYVQMLERTIEGQLSDKARRYLKTIAGASMEMGQLIDDLLAFSRMGRTEMRNTLVPLDTLVESSIQSLEMAVKGRNILWKIASLPIVKGDPSMLKQVFLNLIGNAVKYSAQRTPAEIEIGCQQGENESIVIFVRDNGAGFDMEYAHKLFGVFQRLHRADEFEGTGIGLATARRIIVRHGGRIWAEGKVGGGATFYFSLQPAATNQQNYEAV